MSNIRCIKGNIKVQELHHTIEAITSSQKHNGKKKKKKKKNSL